MSESEEASNERSYKGLKVWQAAMESLCGDIGRMLQVLIASVERRKASAVRETVGHYGSGPDLDGDWGLDYGIGGPQLTR